MRLVEQLKLSLWTAPQSIRLIGKQTLPWLAVYFLAGTFLFSIVIWQLMENEIHIKNALLNYFFPSSWHSVSEELAAFLFDSQSKPVIANAILSGSLVIAAIFLFPLKEQSSALFEKESHLSSGSEQEFPLWLQGWEELKLFIFYITAQSIILWIGYYPYFWTHCISITLSYLFLFFSFGLDFISPTLQRHRKSYSLIIKAALKHPWLILSFGALFSMPVITVSQVTFLFPSLTLVEMTGILFFSNLFFLTLAIPVGTHIASHFMPVVTQTSPPTTRAQSYSYISMVSVLAFMLFLHGGLIASLHHKSQLLKANYSIDWDSFDIQLPSFSSFLNKEATTNFSFDVAITNPTQFDIVIENSQIFVQKSDLTIAAINLNGFEVPAGQTREVKVKLDSLSDLGKITNFRDILENWRVDMHLELWPGIPFIINIAE